MKKIMLLFVGFLFTCTQIVFAQQKTITGTVISADDGLSIPGVSVLVKGTSKGTITDINGKYIINVGNNAVLQFSFVGMHTQEIVVGTSTTINVTLEPETIGVEEVVITALGIKREKKAVGYAATSFGGDEIADSKVVNPMNAIQGKVAGVDISSAPGPGATQNVIIRGASSFGSNQPLYVVDGVPIVNAQNRAGDNLNSQVDFGSGINALNPDDIEDMTVLKGAAATALYGSRAANGVILITTKSGKNTQGKLKVTYDGTVALSRIGRIPMRQDQFGQGWSGYHALEENGNWGPRYDDKMRPWGNVVDNQQQVAPYSFLPDRIRDFYEIGTNYKNAISLMGGNETTNYYFSFSNNQVDGVMPDDVDSYKRTTLSARGAHKADRLTISTSVNYSKEDTKVVPSGQGTSVFRSLWEVPENISVADFKDYNSTFNNLDNYFTPYGINPYFSLYENGSNQDKNKVFGKVQAVYEILNNLTATYRLGGRY